MEERKFCTVCGSHLEPGAKFCTNCGTKVGEEPASTDVYQQQDINTYQQPLQQQEMVNSTDTGDRMNRLPYFGWTMLVGIIESIVWIVITQAFGDGSGNISPATFHDRSATKFIIVVMGEFIMAYYYLDVRRLHDLNQGKAMAYVSAFFLLVINFGDLLTSTANISMDAFMFIGLCAVGELLISLYLFLADGTHGPNRYGADPLNRVI